MIALEQRPVSEIIGDVFEGLTKTPKSLPPRLFYDAAGSALFEEITRLPEYYLTRTEAALLQQYAGEIAERVGPNVNVIELGAGTAAKTGTILKELPAYNDAQGVTARFNKNILARINRELGGNFDLNLFRHVALWNPERSRIEMHLESTVDHGVKIKLIGLEVPFKKGERIHTENSY